MFNGALPAELYPHCGAGSWTRTNDFRLGRLNFLIQNLLYVPLFLYYNYIKFFKNSQGNASRLEQLFFLCVAFHGYKFLVLYNQNNHFSYHRTNNHQYHTKSNWEERDVVCVQHDSYLHLLGRQIRPTYSISSSSIAKSLRNSEAL